jgi:adenylate kinase
MRRALIYKIGQAVCSVFSDIATPSCFKVIHIKANPAELLERRRCDTSRTREVIPSDCVIALRENEHNFLQYQEEILRATINASNAHIVASHHVIHNSNCDDAKKQLTEIFKGAMI